MVKQREGYKFVILEPAKTWLREDKCAGCGKPKSEWKRSTGWKCCSTTCTNKMHKDYQYFGWGDLRLRAIERDNYTCIKCGHIAKKIVRPQIYTTWEEFREHHKQYPATYKILNIDEEKQEIHLRDASQFIVDHIHPIALGGDEWEISNLQTLCKECNKKKTKTDIGNIAKLRTKELLINAGQKFLDEKMPKENI